MDHVARVPAQIPPPRKHLVRYDGYDSNAARGKRRRDHDGLVDADSVKREAAPSAAAAELRKR